MRRFYIRVRSPDVPVAITRRVVEVDVERAIIRAVVGVAAHKGEAHHESLLFIFVFLFCKLRTKFNH